MANNCSVKDKYLLVESDNSYSSVLSPLKSTQRIKYTCFDVSPSFLVFGATSGGLYLFRREPCTFLQLLPNKEGSVSRVAISPDEKLIAFASVRGIVCVLQRAETGTGTRCLNRSIEHSGTSVTAICWVDHSDQVFVGDSQGRLSVINVSLFMGEGEVYKYRTIDHVLEFARLVKITNHHQMRCQNWQWTVVGHVTNSPSEQKMNRSKNMFHVPAFVFMQVDSSVVSVCCHGDRLLVSSHTRCYVCDTAREQYRQIGTKLRDGEYGACYISSDPVRIYCARPGSRLWEVDNEGVVQRTHQLKQILAQPPVLVVHHTRGIIAPEEGVDWPEQSFNFAYLCTIMDKFLFTFKQDGVYIFNPEEADVLLWSNSYKDIVDAKCIGDIIYLWSRSQEMHALQVTPLDKCLLRLYFYKHYNLCSDLCVRFFTLIEQSPEMLSKLGPLLGLKEMLNDSIDKKLQDLLKHIELHVKERELSLRLESGIFLVDNHHARWKLIEKSKSIPRNNQRNLKTRYSRSRSLPPNRRAKQETPKKINYGSRNDSISTNSLPELTNALDSISTEGECNAERHHINNIYNHLFDDAYQDLHIPQLPILPLSSPDIIHDALMEIGSSVSGKLVSGTKSLLNKWHKATQDYLEILDVRSERYVEAEKIKHHLNSAEEVIVEGQSRHTSVYLNIPDIDVSEVVALCKGGTAEVTVELLEELFEKVKILHNIYRKALVNKKSKYSEGVFPFSQYFNKDNFLVIINIFHKSFKNGTVLQWLYNQQNSLVKEELEHPIVFQDVFSTESLQLDSTLSKVLKLFCEVVDPYNILECLELLGLPCTYVSWCVVIDRFQDGTFRYITKYGESDNISCADWPLPLLFNAMFLSFRMEQVDSSFRMAVPRNVTLKTVSYILLKLATHLEVTGTCKSEAEHKCNYLLLSYISKMICKKSELALNDIGLVSHIESAFIEQNAKSDYGVCYCAFPLPGTLINNAKFSEIGEKLISYHWEVYRQKIPLNGVKPDLLSHTSKKIDLCTDIQPKGNETFRQFFETNQESDEPHSQDYRTESEYLKHIMKICGVSSNLLLWTLNNKAPNNGSRVSTVLIVQLGLHSEFEKIMDNNSSQEWWENIVALNADVKRGKCCACHTQWSANRKAGFHWTWLAINLLKHLGSQRTLDLLKKHSKDINPGELDYKFYQACAVTSLVDSRVSGLRPKVLDILQRLSDSKAHRAIMSPQVGEQFKTALAEDACLLPTDGMVSSYNHYWGVSVDMAGGVCTLCLLKLGEVRDVGLRVFVCSHAFHHVCLQRAQSLLYCPLCTR